MLNVNFFGPPGAAYGKYGLIMEKTRKNNLRIGMGYDIHRLVSHRRLVLGGIHIESDIGLLGHSDADAVLHAVIDAMLGAAAWGDIGEFFPDTDPRWKDADSTVLLNCIWTKLISHGYRIQNIDINIIAEKPRLGNAKHKIRNNIAKLLGLRIEQVSVKARTKEGLGSVGKGEAIETSAIVLLYSES